MERPPALTAERTARRLWFMERPPALMLVLSERAVVFVVVFMFVLRVRCWRGVTDLCAPVVPAKTGGVAGIWI
jgi:hypothetical protein